MHKNNVISHNEKQEMLASKPAFVNNIAGLANKFAYYCTKNFIICCGRELKALNSIQFKIVEDKFKEECSR